jgi:hypothetical protein
MIWGHRACVEPKKSAPFLLIFLTKIGFVPKIQMRTKNYACPDDYGSMVLKGHGPCGAPISITKRSQFPLPNPIAGLIGTDPESAI